MQEALQELCQLLLVQIPRYLLQLRVHEVEDILNEGGVERLILSSLKAVLADDSHIVFLLF